MQVAAAWGHHLRHDGGGYPDHPAWAVRHPVTALIQICDVFEALTAVRPYKPPLTPRAAYEIMLKDEGAFDPGLLTAFVSAMGLYPPGNQVRLSDGSLAIVLSAGDDIAKPVVRIMSEATGPPLPHSQQRVIDLAMGSPEKLAVIDLVMD